MPSSTSSSDIRGFDVHGRQQTHATATDLPGMAQPVPLREVPAQPWTRVLAGAAVAAALLLAGWEAYWRAWNPTPAHRNSAGAWAEQRARIDEGEGGATVLVGTSRLLFGVQLPVWERITGERPIQLALEGTSPLPVLEDLADDPDFTGRVLVDATPDLFFSGYAYRGDVVRQYRERGPSKRIGHWLSKHLLEGRLAFYDPDFALPVVVRRQAWPARPGVRPYVMVRKLMQMDADRNTRIWARVEQDADYRALAKRIWAQGFGGPPPGMDTPEKKRAAVEAQVARAVAAVRKLEARGVRVVFVRPPSGGEYYAEEEEHLPRAETWELLLARTGRPGVHFEDHAAMRGLDLPEWSHLSARDAERYTEALATQIQQARLWDVVSTPAPSQVSAAP